MRSLIYVLALSTLIVACKKDKFQTKPSLKLKSISSNVIPVQGNLNVQFEFTDKEGDISDTIFVKKIRTNRVAVKTNLDSFALTIPVIPNHNKGIIELNLTYHFHLVSAESPPSRGNPPNPEDDTLILKFALRDKAKNVSDTVTTEPIIIIR